MPPPNWQTAGEIAGELFDDAVFGARTRGNLGSVPRSIAASERDRLWRQRDQYISSFVRRAQSLGNVSPNILRDQTQRTLLQLPQPPPRISRPITRTPQETFAAKPVQRELNRYTPPATISRAESEGRQGVPGRARTTSQTRQTPEAAGVGYDMKFFGVPTYGDITKVPASVRSKPGFQANWDARGAAIARSANIITSGERKSAQVEQDVLARQYPGLAPDKRYDPTLQYGQDVNEAIKTGDFGPSADAFRVLTRGLVSASLGVDTAKAFATWLAKEQPGIRTDSDPELLARPFGIFLSQPASAIYATSTGDTRMPQERPEALNTALTVGDVLLPILAMNGEASATKLSSLSGAERTAELGRIASRVLSADVLGNYSAMKDAGGPLNMAGGMIGSISSAFAPDTPFSQRIGGAAMLGIGALGGSHMLNGAADRLSSLLRDSPREMVKPPVVDTYQYDPKADLARAFNEPVAEKPKPKTARKPKAAPAEKPAEAPVVESPKPNLVPAENPKPKAGMSAKKQPVKPSPEVVPPEPKPKPAVSRETKVAKPDVKPEIPKAETKPRLEIVRETKKALYIKTDDGREGWIQRRWLREDGTLTPKGSENLKTADEAKAINEAYKEARDPNSLVRINIDRQTEKAVAMKISGETLDGEHDWHELVWFPKSVVKDGDSVPRWALDQRMNEINVRILGKKFISEDGLARTKVEAAVPRTAKDALADAKSAVQDFKDAPGPKGIKQGKRSGAAMVPLSPQKVEALGRAVKHYIEAGVLTVKEMHERIKADLGDYWDDGLRPHIAKIFKEHMSSGSQAEKPGPESPKAEKSTVKRASTPDVTTQVAQEPLDRLRNDLGMNAVDKKGTRLVAVVNSKIAKDIEAGGATFAREYNAKPSRGSLTAEETAGIGRAIVSTLDKLKASEKAVSDHISSGNVDQAAREDVQASLLRNDLAELTLAGHRGGSEWGLSGITRRLELKKDYSTDGILHKLVSAVKRKPTEEEVGKAGALSDKINTSAADIDEAIKAEVDRRVQEYIAAQTAPRSPRGAKNNLFTQSSYDAVIARRKGARMSSKRSGSTNLSALDIADTATILGYHIEAGIRSFADLATSVRDVIPNATDADIAGIADRVLKEMHESNKRPPPKSKGATIARLKLEVKQLTDPTVIEKATKLIEQLKQEPINATSEFWHDRYRQVVGQMREMSVGSRIAEDFLRSGADGIQSPQIRDLRVSLNRLKADADHWIQAHEKEGRTKLQHAVGLLGDVISLPKAFKASIDMSAIGRQGLMLFMANPARARGAFAAQFKAFSKLGAERVLADMQAHRSYDLARESKLAIMDFTSSHLFPAEEEFLSSIAGNIPGIAQSERMYASYLSQLRLDWFDHMVSNIESSGDRVSIKEAKQIAHMINVATGRGTLGKFETSANLIGKLLFSVRFPVSRIQFLLGQPLWKGALDPKTRISPRVAKEIGKLYAQTAIGYATTAVVLGLIGAKVGQDPDKSDYLKLRYGPLGIDLSAGLTKYFVLSNRIATDRMSSYRAQALARGMLAPVSGVAADFAFNHGRNPYKQETIPGKRPGTTKEQDRAYDWWDALELFTPIGADQAVQNQQSGLSSDEQIIGAAADFLGFGSNQYKDD